MIRELHATGFKSLRPKTRIELGRVNVFIGANGSGKSNILEALGLLSAAAGGRVDDEALERRGVRLGTPALIKSSFQGEERPTRVDVGVRSEDAEYDVGLVNSIDEPGPEWRYDTERLASGEAQWFDRRQGNRNVLNPTAGFAALKRVELDPDDPAMVLLDRLKDYRIYAPGTPFLRGLVPDRAAQPLGLSGGRLAEAVDELMRSDSWNDEALDELRDMITWAASFRAVPTSDSVLARGVPATTTVLEFVDRFMAEGENRLTAYDASEGALYVLFSSVVALHRGAPQIAAIDNFDQALNPRLARRLVAFLCDAMPRIAPRRQLLLTCHNPTVLDGLPLQDDETRLFAVDRDLNGHTIVTRIEVTPALLAKAAEGWTLSRLWVMGHLGGVPDV